MRYIPASLPLLLLLLTAAADPPPAEIVAQRGSVQITTAQLVSILASMDPATRTRLEGTPGALSEFVRERVISQMVLDEARAKGWDRRPDIRQRADEARDQVVMQSFVSSMVPVDPNGPTEAEIAAAYEANKTRFVLPRQYHLAQIVVLVPPNAGNDTEETARRKAADLRAQAVRHKADFADLARKNSQEAASAPRGGDVGWVREDQLLPAVRDAVAKLPDGSVTEAVRAPDGWHVLRLIEIRPPGPMSLAEATPQLVQAMRQAKAQQMMRNYIAGLLQNQPVQINEIALTKATSEK